MPITIVAHRGSHRSGLHRNLPENSLEAFAAAWNCGIAWVECDVHFTRDGIAVILHDDTLDRTTTGSGRVDAKLLRELEGLRLRDAVGRPTECAIPMLQSALDAMPAAGGMLIEFKRIPQTPAAIDLLQKCASRLVAYQSFHEADLPLFEQANPRGGFSWLLDSAADIEVGILSRWKSLHVNFRHLNEAAAQRLAAGGKTFGAWTVNDAPSLRRMALLGARTIITDNPQLAQRKLSKF